MKNYYCFSLIVSLLFFFHFESKAQCEITTPTISINGTEITGTTFEMCVGSTYTIQGNVPVATAETGAWTSGLIGAIGTVASQSYTPTSTTPVTFTWEISTTVDGCTPATKTVNVFIKDVPQQGFITGLREICVADPSPQNYTANGFTDATSYRWVWRGNSQTSTSDSYNLTQVNYGTGTGILQVFPQNECGEGVPVSQQIYIYLATSLTVGIHAQVDGQIVDRICPESSVRFVASPSNGLDPMNEYTFTRIRGSYLISTKTNDPVSDEMFPFELLDGDVVRVTLTAPLAGCYTGLNTANRGIVVNVHQVKEIEPSQLGAFLSVNADYSDYQWFNVENPEHILSNEANYTAVENGEYRVRVYSQDGCEKVSDIFSVTILGSKDNGAESRFSLYPIPAHDLLNLDNVLGANIQLLDISGKEISIIKNAQYSERIQVGHLDDGMYFIRISNESEVLFKKILVKK